MRKLIDLHNEVAAVCPIDGLNGDLADKASIRIDYRPEATAEQRAAAQAVIATFDASAPEVPVQIELWKARIILKSTPWTGNYGGTGKTMFDAAQAAIADFPPAKRFAASEAFEYTNFLTRDGSIVNAFQAALGLSDQQVDDLFVQAAAIQS